MCDADAELRLRRGQEIISRTICPWISERPASCTRLRGRVMNLGARWVRGTATASCTDNMQRTPAKTADNDTESFIMATKRTSQFLAKQEWKERNQSKTKSQKERKNPAWGGPKDEREKNEWEMGTVEYLPLYVRPPFLFTRWLYL